MPNIYKQTFDLLDFKWSRCPDGYKLIATDSEKGTSAFAIIPKSGKLECLYPIKENPGLARELAQLASINEKQPSRLAIQFVEKYGLLGNCMEAETEGNGENLQSFIKSAREFDKIFRLHDSEAQEDRLAAIRAFNISHLLLDLFPVISFEQNQKRRQIRFDPKNLLTAAWMLLGAELTNGLNIIQCQRAGCTRWTDFRSKRKKFCSDACRKARSRKDMLGQLD